MEQISNFLAKLGLSVKNALYIVGAALAVWLLLGTKKGRTYVRRARRTTARRATSATRRATSYVRTRYNAYRTRRVARRK